MILECVGVSKSYRKGGLLSKYPDHRVLEDISLSIARGRSLGLLGRNGAGKSTLTRIILGLEKPDKGKVLFNGEDIHSMLSSGDKSFRVGIQAVFQDAPSAMNPRWSALAVISEPLINFTEMTGNELRGKVLELMEAVGLDRRDIDKNCTKFSGGQQQRICIARALALNPQLLVLDEAVSSLDMLVQSQIVNLLKELKAKFKLSILLISHDLRVIFQLCEDIVVLDNGKVVDRLSIEEGVSSAQSSTFNSLLNAIVE